MEHLKLAEHYHDTGFGCAQAVLGAYRQEFGLDEATALRLSTGFGSGMGRLCQVCGALTGGFMVIGLKHGKEVTDGTKYGTETETTYALVRELARRFEERNGTIFCRELLGLDLNDPEQLAIARNEGLFQTRCAGYIRDSVELLEEIL